jgi:hypothetical protein
MPDIHFVGILDYGSDLGTPVVAVVVGEMYFTVWIKVLQLFD